MVILALINKNNISNALVCKFLAGNTVYFIVDESRRIIKGTIVKVDYVYGEGNEKEHFQYTIESTDEHESFEVPDENVSDNLDNLLEKKGLKIFNCHIFMDRDWCLSETVVAETLDDAIAYLKEEYPNAYSIREADPWR